MPRLRLPLTFALAAVVAGVLAGAGSARQLRYDELVPSQALAGPMHALVVLPPGYWTSGKRYPVVYFLHGLPAGSTTYRANGWLASALAQAGRAILVEAEGARDDDSDAEYLDWGSGRNWQTYVARELPAYVDAHFRTIRDRSGRALIGLSAGGYGAAAAALTHLDRFSVIESWSGYFHPTDPSGESAIDGGPNSNLHGLVTALKHDERQRATYLGFYVGRGDGRFLAENEQFDRELRSADVPHVFAVYPGGHATSLWRRHARDWLARALAHLASPTA
jgi:enterochelin esterase-like enzyme